MATRRPKVPSAQFTAGSDKAPAVADEQPLTPVSESAPSPKKTARRTPVSAGKAPAGKARTASAADAPTAHGPGHHAHSQERSRQDGVIHDASSTPVPARSFSGRLLVIGLAMAAITVVLAPNVHTFMEQRAEISALKQDIAQKTQQQATYQSELARWNDPAFVKQQARDRVSMLMPGETGYWVYGADGVEAITGSADADKAAAAAATSAKNATEVTTEPWVDRLLSSIQKSSQVAVDPAANAADPKEKPTTPPAGK